MKASWPFVRREVLRSHSWNSATARASLAALVATPEWGFDSAYQIPADCLQVLEVDNGVQWRVEGQTIVTDGTDELDIRYMQDVTDTEQYDSLLTDVMVVRLAIEIVERITDSTTKRAALLQEYGLLMDEARMQDGSEQSPAEFEEDAWITARY